MRGYQASDFIQPSDQYLTFGTHRLGPESTQISVVHFRSQRRPRMPKAVARAVLRFWGAPAPWRTLGAGDSPFSNSYSAMDLVPHAR